MHPGEHRRARLANAERTDHLIVHRHGREIGHCVRSASGRWLPVYRAPARQLAERPNLEAAERAIIDAAKADGR